jgi:hypothetical protein
MKYKCGESILYFQFLFWYFCESVIVFILHFLVPPEIWLFKYPFVAGSWRQWFK